MEKRRNSLLDGISGMTNRLLLLVFLSFGLSAFSSSAWASEPGQDTAGTEWIILKVEGMTCSSCELQVKRALKKVPGVKEAKPSAEAGNARILYETAKAKPEDLVKAINRAGYRASLPDSGQSDG